MKWYVARINQMVYLEYVSRTNQIAALGYVSHTNQIAALRYVSRTIISQNLDILLQSQCLGILCL